MKSILHSLQLIEEGALSRAQQKAIFAKRGKRKVSHNRPMKDPYIDGLGILKTRYGSVDYRASDNLDVRRLKKEMETPGSGVRSKIAQSLKLRRKALRERSNSNDKGYQSPEYRTYRKDFDKSQSIVKSIRKKYSTNPGISGYEKWVSDMIGPDALADERENFNSVLQQFDSKSQKSILSDLSRMTKNQHTNAWAGGISDTPRAPRGASSAFKKFHSKWLKTTRDS